MRKILKSFLFTFICSFMMISVAYAEDPLDSLEDNISEDVIDNASENQVNLETETPINENEEVIDELDEPIQQQSNNQEVSTNSNSIQNNLLQSQIKNGLIVEDDGNTYYYINGIKQRGYQVVNGKKYFFGEASYKMFKNCLVTSLAGNTYYPDANGVLQTGIIDYKGQSYYFDNNGIRRSGVQTVNGKKYFFGEASYKMFKDCLVASLAGNTYYPDANGVLQTGIVNYEGQSYYFDNNGIRRSGVQTVNGKKYFFGEASYKMFKDCLVTSISGLTYYPDANGVLQTGIIDYKGQSYYFDDNGVMQRGYQVVDGKAYFFGENTYKMFKDCLVTSMAGLTYYAGEDGVLKTGVQNYNNKVYFFGENTHKMFKNCLVTSTEGLTYYAGANGILKTGVQSYNNKVYFFGENTYKMFKDCLVTSMAGLTYYAGVDGVLKTGVQSYNNKVYFFGEASYKMFKNSFVTSLENKTYYADTDGVLLVGIQNIGGVDYDFGTDGVLKTGFRDINGKTYYYYLNGSIAKGVQKVEGVRCWFDFTTGELLRRNVKTIIDVSDYQHVDWDGLWASGSIDGAILRIGYGTSRTDDCVMDSQFEYNLAAVRRLGIPYSIYLFTYAQTEFAAEKEANFVADVLASRGVSSSELSMPIFFDAEITSWRGVSYDAGLYSITLSIFANTLRNRGYSNVGIYGSCTWLDTPNGRLNSETIRNYPVWVAQYYHTNQYSGNWIGWQYTSSATWPYMSYITGTSSVDISVFL